jgi:hypothetical protein
VELNEQTNGIWLSVANLHFYETLVANLHAFKAIVYICVPISSMNINSQVKILRMVKLWQNRARSTSISDLGILYSKNTLFHFNVFHLNLLLLLEVIDVLCVAQI